MYAIILWLMENKALFGLGHTPRDPLYRGSFIIQIRWISMFLFDKQWSDQGSVLLLLSDAVASLLPNSNTAFKWKLHCHWLPGLHQRQIVVVIRSPCHSCATVTTDEMLWSCATVTTDEMSWRCATVTTAGVLWRIPIFDRIRSLNTTRELS